MSFPCCLQSLPAIQSNDEHILQQPRSSAVGREQKKKKEEEETSIDGEKWNSLVSSVTLEPRWAVEIGGTTLELPKGIQMVQRNTINAPGGPSSITTSVPPNENRKFTQRVQIIRTLSKAGIPQRIPTIYRTDAKLLIPPSPGSRGYQVGQEDHSNVFVELPAGYQGDLDIIAEKSSSSLQLAPTSPKLEHTMSGSRRPKIQVVIPQHPVKNPEFVTQDTKHASKSAEATSSNRARRRYDVDEPLTATTPMTVQAVNMATADDLLEEENFEDNDDEEEEEDESEKAAAAAAHQRSISTATNRSDQTQTSDVSGSSASRHSASSQSSLSSISESPEHQAGYTSKGEASNYAGPNATPAGVYEEDSKEPRGKARQGRRSIEESKKKPLPPEPSRQVGPLLLRKKPSHSNLASPKLSSSSSRPLVSKFSSRELRNHDKNSERSGTRPQIRTGQTRMHLVQAARDLENQLAVIPDPKDGSSRSVASDERTLVASYHDRSPVKLDMEGDAVRQSIAEEPTKTQEGPRKGQGDPHMDRPSVQVDDAIGFESFLCDGDDGCPLCDGKEALQATESNEDTTVDSDVIAPDDAALLLLYIMEQLDDLSDLYAAAFVNRGFYLTFKKHELRLIRRVLHNGSPAAWELRDVSLPWTDTEDFDFDSPVPDYTSSTYLQAYSQDTNTITDLKSLILARCESFLRLETVTGLSGMNQQRATELNEAFWRIWTFCRIFGCKKNRENDLVAQMDWLRGGSLARASRSPPLRPTSMASEDFAADSALFAPSKSFGTGNGPDGLTAPQLYDMIEIWNCLGVLVQQLSTNVNDAKSNGVFQNCDVNDAAEELRMLEEWTYYILTLGPSVILSLSCLADQSTTPAFERAMSSGWTNWTPPSPGSSRSSFLKEALTRVYNERLSKLASRSTTPESISANSQDDPSERSNSPRRSPSVRNRQQALAEELRQQARQPSESKPHKERQLTKSASFNQERPMSDFPNIITQLAGKQSHSIHDHELPIPVAMEHPAFHQMSHHESAYATTAQRLQQQSAIAHSHRFPGKVQRPKYSGAAYEMQRYQFPETPEEEMDVVDPVDFALWTLTREHGFSREEAVWALRKFETGESVNVDKAVALLLRQRELGHPTTKRLEAWTGSEERTPVQANPSVVWSRPEDLESIRRTASRPDVSNSRDTVIISPISNAQPCCPHCSTTRVNTSIASPIPNYNTQTSFAIDAAVVGKGPSRSNNTMSKDEPHSTSALQRHFRSVRDVYCPIYRTYSYMKGAGKGIRQARFSGSAAPRSGSLAVNKGVNITAVPEEVVVAPTSTASTAPRLADLKRLSVDLHRSVILPIRPGSSSEKLWEEAFEGDEGRQGSVNASFIGSDGGSDKETVVTASTMSGVEGDVLPQRRGGSPVSSMDSAPEEKVVAHQRHTVRKTPTGFIAVPYSLPAVYH